MTLKQLKTTNFQEHIEQGNVLVQFSSPTCQPCKMLQPLLEELNSENTNVEVYKVDVFEESQLAQQYSIMSVPTTMLFNEGEIVDMVSGFRPKEYFEEVVNKYI